MNRKSVIHSGKRNDRHLSGNIGNRACRTPFPIFATQLTQAFSGNHRMNARGHFDQTKGSSRRLPVRGYGTSASRTAEAIFVIVNIAVRIEVGAVEPLLRERDLIRQRLERKLKVFRCLTTHAPVRCERLKRVSRHDWNGLR